MKLLNDDEVTVYSALIRHKCPDETFKSLVKAGMERSTAKRLLSKIQKQIKKENRKSAVPKILGGVIFSLIVWVIMGFVAGPVQWMLLIALVMGAITVFKGLMQYLSPSPAQLEE